ncbi:MAG TPA: DUF5615 family PIN-like protein [Niabella sp.]|nr:DUF5615 family PIN-like protein [Niabella sp.]
MKLLLDANISWKLCSRLSGVFGECHHVDLIGLKVPARDIEIWQYALENGLNIVTNDEDFLNLSNLKGFPPKVILIKTGNQSSEQVYNLLKRRTQDIHSLIHSNDIGVLELI